MTFTICNILFFEVEYVISVCFVEETVSPSPSSPPELNQ